MSTVVDDFKEYRRLILDGLEKLEARMTTLENAVNELKTGQSVLNTKVAIYSAAAGSGSGGLIFAILQFTSGK